MNLLEEAIKLLSISLTNLQKYQQQCNGEKDSLPIKNISFKPIEGNFENSLQEPYVGLDELEFEEQKMNKTQFDKDGIGCINQMILKFREKQQIDVKDKLDWDFIHSKKRYKLLRKTLNSIVSQTAKQMKPHSNVSYKQNHCPFCEFQGQLSHVSEHVIKKHGNNYYLYSCGYCGKDFQSYQMLIKHLEKYHKNHIINQNLESKFQKLEKGASKEKQDNLRKGLFKKKIKLSENDKMRSNKPIGPHEGQITIQL